MMWILFLMGALVTFIGLYSFDAQPAITFKLASIPVIVIGVSMMVGAIYMRGL